MKLLLPLTVFAPLAALGCGGFYYEAPPTLGHYPERFPVKTMRALLREAQPAPAEYPSFDELDRETRDLVAGLTAAPRETVLKRIDIELERNRRGEYRKRFANCLNDLHDLLIDGAAEEAAAGDYLDVRLKILVEDDGFIHRPEVRDEEDHRTAAEREVTRLAKPDEKAADLAAQAAKASPALRPHWLVLLGAYRFQAAEFGEAAKIFAALIHDFPSHPRAEIASLMLARCRLEQWRDNGKGPEAEKLADEADGAFAAYLESYPKGRFARDVPGWRVNLASGRGDLSGAFALLLEQMDENAHPEIIRRAAQEMDRLLQETDLSGRSNEFGPEEAKDPEQALPVEQLARRPLAALAVVYHFLDARCAEDFNELVEPHEFLTTLDAAQAQREPTLRIRVAGEWFLPKLAEALGKHREEVAALWRPKFLAVLAWAASESGNQQQAVRLCEMAGPALAGSDDLRFARAVALQRAGDLAGARRAFEELRTAFPKSLLRNEFSFRLITVLRDQHEAGLAVAELLRPGTEMTVESDAPIQEESKTRRTEDDVAGVIEDANQKTTPPGSAELTIVPSLHPPSELAQWLDTLTQFAPLDELERGLAAIKGDEETEGNFRTLLFNRALAAEDFARARRFLDARKEQKEAPDDPGKATAPRPLAGDELARSVAELGRLTKAAAASKIDAAKAKAEFELAEAWAKARGRLTMPGEEEGFGGIPDADYSPDGESRQKNAAVAGYPPALVARELESRDELVHALPHYLAAADLAKGSALGFNALRRANEALRQIAERTTWSAGRAFELNYEALSRGCWGRLQADSSRARLGVSKGDVWWSFRASLEHPWTTELAGGPGHEGEVLILAWLTGKKTTEDPDSSRAPGDEQWEDYDAPRTKLKALAAHAADWDPPRLREALEKFRAEFRPTIVSARGTSILNDLDDLILFLGEPGLTRVAQNAYFAVRIGGADAGGDHPELEPWKDYPAFLRLVRETQGVDPENDRPRTRPMAERMREFLEKFPHSRKREAAMVRLAVAEARACHGHAGVTDIGEVQSPELPGGETIEASNANPDRLPVALQALAAYRKEFPEGRYAADLRLWRGVVAVDEKNWERALADLNATLDDPGQADLHLDAALNLGLTYLQLLAQPEEREAIIEALRRQPGAQRRLWLFISGETPGARLRILEGYLRSRLSGG